MRFIPKQVFTIITSVAITGALYVWLLILIMHMKFRKSLKESGLPKYHLPFYPILNILGIVFLVLVIIVMAFMPDGRIALYVAIPWFGILTAAYYIKKTLLSISVLALFANTSYALSLSEVQSLSANNNYQIEQYESLYESSKESKQSAFKNFLPNLSTNYSYTTYTKSRLAKITSGLLKCKARTKASLC
ncbi:MAG TPA: amino acid permease [Desulfurella acetivorans]|uniref:Amino acid permease n=1 Tax=Desulfurella acetivorans TaxID=33002 RepID=A0A7C6A7T5_DESAE|nr:amino acid permease [Desulfurella acetivorans]